MKISSVARAGAFAFVFALASSDPGQSAAAKPSAGGARHPDIIFMTADNFG